MFFRAFMKTAVHKGRGIVGSELQLTINLATDFNDCSELYKGHENVKNREGGRLSMEE